MRRTLPFFLLLILALSLMAIGCSNPSGSTASISGHTESIAAVTEPSPSVSTEKQTPDTPGTVDPAILEASRTPISYSKNTWKAVGAISSGQETPMGMPLGMTLSSAGSSYENQAGNFTTPELALLVEKQALTKAELSAKKVGLILVRKIVVAQVPTRKPVAQKKASTDRSPRPPSSGPQPNPTPMKKLR